VLIERKPIFQKRVPGWAHYQERTKRTAAMTCPTCGHMFSLLNHSIAADGSVTPSVVCPWSCGFHVFVRLNEWSAA
jgi:DNA-directed RNA polymerase subunit RPC12/RpoP